MKDIIIIGAGGHSRSAIDILKGLNEYEILGIVDNDLEVGSLVGGHTVIGSDSDLKKLQLLSSNALIAVGQIKDPFVRSHLYQQLKDFGFNLPTVVSHTATISENAIIGDGTIIMNGAIINSGAKIGANCIINTGCIVEHDVDIGVNCHISTRSVLNGGVKVGDSSFIGSGSIVRNDISIGKRCIIGMGSLVYKNIDNDKTIYD